MDVAPQPYATRQRTAAAAAKTASTTTSAAPKRALGDITNATNAAAGAGGGGAAAVKRAPPPRKAAAAAATGTTAGGLSTASQDAAGQRTRRSTRSTTGKAAAAAAAAAVAAVASGSSRGKADSVLTDVGNSHARTGRAKKRGAKGQSIGSTIDVFSDLALRKGLGGVLPPGVIDIDAEDRENPLCANELRHITKIFASHRRREEQFRPRCDYMTGQTDINDKMRSILVDWLVDVHQKFKLVPETMYLTIHIIDRFLGLKVIGRQKLQLVGVTAMLVASKYNEIYAPDISDFVYISDNAYTRDEILRMEALILEELNFDITVPSALTFIQRFLKASGSTDKMVASWAGYILELSLQDFKMLRFKPSEIAAAACLLAGTLTEEFVWDATLQYYSGYDRDGIVDCANDLLNLVLREQAYAADPDLSRMGKLTAIRRKYNSPKFCEVSKKRVCEDVREVLLER